MTRILFAIVLLLMATPAGALAQARPALDPAAIKVVDPLYPGFTEILEHGDAEALTRLARVLSDRPSPESLSVLLWMLKHCPSWPLDGIALTQLATTVRAVGTLPFAQVADALAGTTADQRIAALFLLSDHALIADGDQARLDRTLISALTDPIERVREFALAGLRGRRTPAAAAAVREYRSTHPEPASPELTARTDALRALARRGAADAVSQIARVLDPPFRETYELSTAVESLAVLGRTAALPALERFARSTAPEAIREAAVAAYISIAKPADPGAHVRRLLWEQPRTPLEKEVMTRGNAALPQVWRVLASTSREQQRTAAALLGWFRDAGSIPPILSALDGEPGALTREQLIFDLNMILLTEAPLAAPADRNALAALHLRWLHAQLSVGSLDNNTRELVTAKEPVLLHPQGLLAPFAAAWGSTTTVLASSPEVFVEATRKGRGGIAFHAITAADGVARVATTVYLPHRVVSNPTWISLYRREGGRWVALPVPPQPVVRRMINQPNLLPAINRNYGADHPLKILRLDQTMERVRVDFDHRLALWQNENIEKPGYQSELDASYLPLLERYRRADSAPVTYAAEFAVTRLTKQPNLSLWIEALGPRSEPRIRQLAVEILAEYVHPRFRTEGRQLAGPARTALVNAALATDAVNSGLLRKPPPELQHVVDAREWERFGLVDLRFGSGPRAESGYSMLFERRGTRWVFLCTVAGWIS